MTELLIVGLALCGAVAWIVASSRGFDWWLPWVVTGFVLGPLAIVAAFLMRPPDRDVDE